jgi:ADP-heptose:LPS heptosyltransferase
MLGNKILLMHQGAIGDLILSLPAFYSIRKKIPEARFEVMGYPKVLSLIHKRYYADAIVSVDRAGVASLYNEDGCLNEELQHYLRQFEKVFIFGSKSQAVVIKNIQRIKDGPEVYHVKTFPVTLDVHVIDFQLNQLAMLGFENTHNIPEIFLCAEDINNAQNFLYQKGIDMKNNPLIAVHAGSGSKAKNWPLENYVFLVQSIYQRCRGTVLVVEGPAERNLIDNMSEALDGSNCIALQSLALPLLAAVLSQCSLFIGNDSGNTHLAAALGVPVIALFGPTDPCVWGPRGKKVYIARGELDDGSGWKWASIEAVLKVALNCLDKK